MSRRLRSFIGLLILLALEAFLVWLWGWHLLVVGLGSWLAAEAIVRFFKLSDRGYWR
jgi:hypothetical protein